MTKYTIRASVYFILIVMPIITGYSQKFITDTTYINFLSDSIFSIQAKNIEINDYRKTNNVLKIGEKRKYYLFTIDHYYCTQKPLYQEIQQSFSFNPVNNIQYNITIDTFALEALSKWNSGGTLLFASFNLQLKDNDTVKNLGNLVYETLYKKKPFEGKKNDPYQKVIDQWKYEFAADLNKLSFQLSNNLPTDLYNLRDYNLSNRTNLIFGSMFHYGLKSYLIDGEIIFSNPETNQMFKRHSSILRYRQSDGFKSLEFNIMNESLNYRFNSNYLGQIRTGLFLGLNNWEDMKESEHNFADLIILDLSSSQFIMYNPINKKSILGGIGITESIYYTYSRSYKIEPFIMIFFGIKL